MYYTLIFVGLFLTIGSQLYIESKYNKTRLIKNDKNLTGAEAARIILDKNNITDVRVEKVHGRLSDHYDPTNKVVRLSSDIYDNPSVASVAVAAHECGHVIQHHNGYKFLTIRNKIIPMVNFSSKAGYFAVLFGLLFQFNGLLWLGIILELVIILFQVLTLPVEFDASNRALKEIKKYNLLNEKEHKYGAKMLIAAALTYVAGVATALLELLRLVMIASSNSDN